MAMIQGLTHFSSIVLGSCIKKLDIDIKESMEYTSPIYKINMDMIGRVLAQDPRLYADIEIENPYMKDALNALEKSIKELKKCVEEKDTPGFVEYFTSSSSYLGDFKKTAMEESNFLIKKMVMKNKR